MLKKVHSDPSTIPGRLKELRLSLNLNQKEFSERIGIARAYWSTLETGKKELTGNVIRKLMSEFDISADWVIDGVGNRQRGSAINENVNHLKNIHRLQLEDRFTVRPLLDTILRLKLILKSLINEGKKIELNESEIELIAAAHKEYHEAFQKMNFQSDPSEIENLKEASLDTISKYVLDVGQLINQIESYLYDGISNGWIILNKKPPQNPTDKKPHSSSIIEELLVRSRKD